MLKVAASKYQGTIILKGFSFFFFKKILLGVLFKLTSVFKPCILRNRLNLKNIGSLLSADFAKRVINAEVSNPLYNITHLFFLCNPIVYFNPKSVKQNCGSRRHSIALVNLLCEKTRPGISFELCYGSDDSYETSSLLVKIKMQ